MWKKISLLTFLYLFINANVPYFSALLTDLLHKICLDINPTEAPYRPLYAGMVCGAQPPPSLLLVQLRQSGLYHLLVVSGAHLLFLESLLIYVTRRFSTRRQSLIVFVILFLYAHTTLLAPPVTRALLGFLVHRLNLEEKLFWHGWHITFVAGLITLLIHPGWLFSWSLLLSWAAATLLQQSAGRTSWQTASLMYLGLFPILALFSSPHPSSILFNLVLGPPLGFVLFPACILCFFLPPLTAVIDRLWDALFWLHQVFLPTTATTSFAPAKSALAWGWVYILTLQYLSFLWQQHHRRSAL